MFKFNISDSLMKKLEKLNKKDKVLVQNFKKKVKKVINKNSKSINSYKNLKRPLQNYKGIHLSDKFILLFQVDVKNNFILFLDIKHWNKAYE